MHGALVTALVLSKNTGQARSAAPTRADLHRETLPQVWVVQLAQQVEPRLVSSQSTVALGFIGMCCAFIVAVLLLSGCSETSSLDAAQRSFEHSANWPAPSDFESWRATGALKCHDYDDLRTCEAVFSRFEDGRPIGKDRVAFACSPSVCVWVDP